MSSHKTTDNPYQLAKGKGGSKLPEATVRAPTLTEAEQREKLAGYVVVPADLMPFVKYGTHVRYIETAARGGEYRSGGFVLNNPFDVKPRGAPTEKRFIKIQNGFNKAARDHKEWIVAYEDIEFLYVKGGGWSSPSSATSNPLSRRSTRT